MIQFLPNFLSEPINLSLTMITIIALIYVFVHHRRQQPILSLIDIILGYFPILIHEMGHVIANKLSGGKPKDLVVVWRRKERMETGRQGYAVTGSKSRLNQFITTLFGYIMPPIMLILGVWLKHHTFGPIFLIILLIMFLFYVILTSKKFIPSIILVIIAVALYEVLSAPNIHDFGQIITYIYHISLGTLLGEVAQSSITIFLLTFSRSRQEWDGSQLRQLTKIPTIFFSVIWIVINVYAVMYTFNILWP
ncbi:M50 family metallopeptidase [Mammaliicoccus sciuri]|uniref:M50 family metallopeptidase n=1 Tax=Mammaliicoccus sciuri TaxID=1296 RepID=UPI002DBFF514|nr:M50 family metallopeptidase [Mammaliicoccus sciuri]MEB6195063.1 M50 family metallopeptidase [Mammaliicoccus sciuri]MEB6215767.1 M50 family metallopeptidase [Mammaliicoccus sciuri]MEB6301516.1 M50 family metallopeptidase [Mammaliicoccus sciuri]MEB6330886.1 M50 family metallopeptidase [Mammaliicoccus sciuri]MEB6342648.1 M50 family metallopeptidase [Mammaliicoccus sciuri]